MGFIWFVIGILLLLIVVYKWILCKPENFPPGNLKILLINKKEQSENYCEYSFYFH